METVTKLITQLQSKCIPKVKFWVQQWVKDHIVDECPEEDSDLF